MAKGRYDELCAIQIAADKRAMDSEPKERAVLDGILGGFREYIGCTPAQWERLDLAPAALGPPDPKPIVKSGPPKPPFDVVKTTKKAAAKKKPVRAAEPPRMKATLFQSGLADALQKATTVRVAGWLISVVSIHLHRPVPITIGVRHAGDSFEVECLGANAIVSAGDASHCAAFYAEAFARVRAHIESPIVGSALPAYRAS